MFYHRTNLKGDKSGGAAMPTEWITDELFVFLFLL
jgi:hypothetical protein